MGHIKHIMRRIDRTVAAVAAILLSVLALSFGDALVKLSSTTFSIWQMYVLRSAIALVLLFVLLRYQAPGMSLFPSAFLWALLRSLLLAAMWAAYYVALPFMPLSVAAAAYYTIPLFITLFSALFVGEPVGPRGWFAVALGFVGMLVVLRPDADGVNGYVLLPVVAAILYALAMILTRTKCRKEHPLVLSIMLNGTFVAVGAIMTSILIVLPPPDHAVSLFPFLLSGWASLDGMALGVLAALAVIIIVGSTSSAFAYQNGPPSVISTFDYGYLAFAVLWGVLLFGEVPDAVTAVGIGLIAVAGILAVRR